MRIHSLFHANSRTANSPLYAFGLAILFAIVLPGAPAAHAQVVYNGVLTVAGSGFVQPTGVAVDSAGNLFVTDLSRTTITEIPANGGAPIAISSGFNFPQGIAIDGGGNLFVADTDNNAVKLISAISGYTTVSTLGSGFSQPFSIALDGQGNVFVADTSNAQVKEITAMSGYATVNVLGGSFAFSAPEGIALDGLGNVYVADRKLAEVVELPITGNYATGAVLASGFTSPRGVTVDAAGNVYVTDINSLKEITVASGLTSVVTAYSSLNLAEGLTTDSGGNIYIADENNSRVVKFNASNVVFGAQPIGSAVSVSLPFTIPAGATVGSVSILTQGAPGKDFTDAGGSTCVAQNYTALTACTVNLQFKPLAAGARNGALVLTDPSGNLLADVPLSGLGNGPQIAYLPGSQTVLPNPFPGPLTAVAIDGNGNVFASYFTKGVYEFPAGGGAPISIGNFTTAQQLAVDGSGNLFIASFHGSTISEALAASGYTTIQSVGSGFTSPTALAIDGIGNLYVTDSTSLSITELFAAGGYTATRNLGGGFKSLAELAVDGAGNLFVYDSHASSLYEITPASGSIQTLQSNLSISANGMVIDASHNLYFGLGFPAQVEELLADGGYNNLQVLRTGYQEVAALAIDSLGNLYAGDVAESAGTFTSTIDKLDLSDPGNVAFPTGTQIGFLDTADGPQTVQIRNIGNQPLIFAVPTTGANPSYPANFPENTASASLCSAGQSISAGASCEVSVEFEPTATGSISAGLVLTDNALNSAKTTQTIALAGVGIAASSKTALTVTPTTVLRGIPVTMTATVTAGATTPTGAVSFLVDNQPFYTSSLTSGKLTASLALPAGAHSVTASFQGGPDFHASLSSATSVTVASTAMTIFSGNAQTAAYGSSFATPLSVALIASTGQPIASQLVNFSATGVTLSSATATTDANGIASVMASAAAVGNLTVKAFYQSATGVAFTLTGTKAPLTFTATSITVPIGQPRPRLQYSVSGLENGDGAGAFTGSPIETTTAASISPAGTYPIAITQGTLASTNYSFVFLPGTCTVAAPLTAASITIASGNSQSAPEGTLFPKSLTVLVRNSAGNPVESASVSFTGNGLTVAPGSVLTNSHGLASVSAVSTRTGTVSATATVAGTNLSVSFTETVP